MKMADFLVIIIPRFPEIRGWRAAGPCRAFSLSNESWLSWFTGRVAAQRSLMNESPRRGGLLLDECYRRKAKLQLALLHPDVGPRAAERRALVAF